jgi:hypothetical protein
VKFLFDANLPPDLAHAIAALCRAEPDVTEVVHLTDRFERSTPDLDWIPALGPGWSIVSIDKFSKNRGQEREALSRAGHAVYVLDPQWSKHSFWKKSAQLVSWWPQLLDHARLHSRGNYKVPWRHTSARTFMGL